MEKLESIVVIDDDLAANFISEKIINHLHITDNLKFFINGEEGLNYLISNSRAKIAQPRLILLDLDMPVMDGFQFLTQYTLLNVSKQNTTIVVLATTSPFSSKIQAVKALGVRYYVSKPLNVLKMQDLCNQLNHNETNNFLFLT